MSRCGIITIRSIGSQDDRREGVGDVERLLLYLGAVEPNFYGYVEPSYANLISGLAVRVNGNALNAGVAPVHGVGRCGETKEQLAFLLSFRK